jgi:hypothetical protein
MRLEIAGLNIQYRNSLDLTEKVKKEFLTAQARRTKLDQEREELRKREKTLERFLGNARPATDTENTGGSHE